MISFISGKIISKEKNSLVVLLGSGMGYEVKVTPEVFLSNALGEEIKLFTYLQVREDAQELYGMETAEELSFFKLLVGVSGVGPKSALHFLALGPIAEIKEAIRNGDIGYLTKVSGIGRKIAERILVELRDKITKSDAGFKAGARGDKLADVIDALLSMGYSLPEAREAARAAGEAENSSKVLKEALKFLNKKK